jgi:CBS domain-containing membrane protein
MSRDLVTVHPDDSSEAALRRLREHALRVLPVVDEHGVVHGAIDIAIAAAAPHARVRDLPSIYFETASEQTPVNQLFLKLSRGRVHEALIVDSRSRLLGIVTQTDLLAVIGRAQLTRGSALEV